MRPLDAYHGNLDLFWPRLSLRGRPSSGLSDSVDAKATECRPEVPHASPIGVGSDGRTSYASVYDVLDRIAEERS